MLPESFARLPLLQAQGVDDVLALLFALAAKSEEVEVLLISLTFGNVEVRKFAVSFPLQRYLLIRLPAVSEMW